MLFCFNLGCVEPQNQEGADRCHGCGSSLWLRDRYAAVRVLGQGSFGRTLLAIDRAGADPALCVVRQCWDSLNWGDRAQSIALFQRKADRLAEIGTHPQIPALLDQFEQEGYLYLVQNYVSGETLAVRLANRGKFSPTEVWQILASLLPVLQFIHSLQVIHRDIKPENIVQRSSIYSAHLEKLGDRPLVLVDYGSATLITESRLPQSDTAIGSPEYAAPEQIKGHSTFASDLYSLGVTCIHLLTDVRPFHLFDFASNVWVWRQYWLPDAGDTETRGDLDRLAQMLDRLIAPALSQRFFSAEAAIAELTKMRGKTIITSSSIPIPNWICSATLSGHQGLFAGVNSVDISPDNHFLASASDDKTIRLWNIATAQEELILLGHTQFVKSVIFYPQDQSILASSSRDRTIKLWHWQHQQEIKTLVGHTNSVNTLAFSPDGTVLASGSSDKTIKLWQWQTDEMPVTLPGATLAVTAIAFSPTAPMLASASSDSVVRLWNLSNFSLVHTLTAHTKAVTAIAYSPDGTLLATGGEDRSIRIWDVKSWQCIHTLSGHPWSVSALAFAADGTQVISASWDKTVKLWDVSTGNEVGVCVGHQDSVNCLAIAAQSAFIASGSLDQTIKLWRSPPRS